MAQDTPLPTTEEISKLLHDNLRGALMRRTRGGRPLVVGLPGGLFPHRTAPAPEITDLDWIMLHRRLGADRFTTFDQVFGPPLTATLRSCGLLDWGAARLPVLAVSACRIAGRLLEQLGRDDPDTIDPSRIPSDFESALQNCLRRASRGQTSLVDVYVRHIADFLRDRVDTYRGDLGRDLTLLRLHRAGETIRADWLAIDGKPARSQTLEDLLGAVAVPVIADLAEHPRRPTRRIGRRHGPARHHEARPHARPPEQHGEPPRQAHPRHHAVPPGRPRSHRRPGETDIRVCRRQDSVHMTGWRAKGSRMQRPTASCLHHHPCRRTTAAH